MFDSHIEDFANQATALGGAGMSTSSFFVFGQIWREGLQMLRTLGLGPTALAHADFKPLVRALGASSVPTELLMTLLGQARSAPWVRPDMVRAVAGRLMAARFELGAGAALDRYLLDWLLGDLLSQPIPTPRSGRAASDRGAMLALGCMDAFFGGLQRPEDRLNDVVQILMEIGKHTPEAAETLLAMAIDVGGRALGAYCSGMADPLVRMRTMTQVLLRTWAENDDLSSDDILSMMLTRLGDRRAIGWMASHTPAWNQVQARWMVDQCLNDLEPRHYRLGVREALASLDREAALAVAASRARFVFVFGIGIVDFHDIPACPVPATRGARPQAQERARLTTPGVTAGPMPLPH